MPHSRPAPEWPTIALAVAIHAAWLTLTAWHAAVPLPLLMAGGGIVIAWHGSLQHEAIHGHPFGRAWADAVVAGVPLSLWLPYRHYRRTHLAHHETPATTDPVRDPESHYVRADGGLNYRLARLEATLAGRLAFGPPVRIGRFLAGEAVRAVRAPRAWAHDWVPHLLTLVPVLWWLDHVGLSIGTYLVAFVWPGTMLTLLRSFAEHRADPARAKRAAIVERGGPLGLIFLNNHLHAVHHARPGLPWYRLPGHYRAHRAAFGAAPLYAGYGEIVRRYLWRAQDGVVHPDHRGRVGAG